MKVLRQDWLSPSKGTVTSISKDRTQLDATYEKVKRQDPEAEWADEPEELTIPDDSVFAEMVEADTVFLHDDEMDIIFDAPEYQT